MPTTRSGLSYRSSSDCLYEEEDHFNNKPKDVDSEFCDELLCQAYNKYVRLFQEESNVALVLDDEDFKLSTSLHIFGRALIIRLAENNDTIYEKMKANKPRMVEQLINGDYGKLNDYVEPESVVIDNADFCGDWNEQTKKTMKDRLTKELYAKRAIVRLTLRVGEVDVVKSEYIAMADSTKYAIKPLAIKDICHDYVEYEMSQLDGDAIYYKHASDEENNAIMVTFWFLLIKIQ